MRVEEPLIWKDGKIGPLTTQALMSKFSEDVQYIRKNVSERALLELIAEEASELSQAALKLIRINQDDTYPVNKDKYDFDTCYSNLVEEITDVYTCCTLLDIEPDTKLSSDKISGMVNRIKDSK